MVEEQTTQSKREQREEYWDPSMYRGRFVMALRCSERGCKDLAVVAGDIVVEEYYDEARHEMVEVFIPRYISPEPELIRLPPEIPDSVAENLRRAFGLIWSDPASAGNRVRVAVERLMDSLRVPKRKRNTKGKYDSLTLHRRIELFASTKHQDLGEQLLAVKWLGNTGSHSDLSRDNVFDALDIVSHVLDELYTQRAKHVTKLAKRINKAKGPAKPIRRRRRT